MTMLPNSQQPSLPWQTSSASESYNFIIWQDGVTNEGLDAISSCFWIKTQKTTQQPNVLSYAVPERDNEFTIYLEPTVNLLFKDKIGPASPKGVWVG